MLPINARLRNTTLSLLFFLPAERRLAMDRWMRGREDYRKLKAADRVVLSFAKSGRTWLRVMVSRFYQRRLGLPDGQVLGFDNFHRVSKSVPKVMFTHDNFLRFYLGSDDTREAYRGRPVLLLARDPRDVAVSRFFHWKFRTREYKTDLLEIPRQDEIEEMYDFVAHPVVGVPRIVEFLNRWEEEMRRRDDLTVVRYEDLRREPVAQLETVLRFLGDDPSVEELQEAVDYASFENLKRLEQERAFGVGRLNPGDPENPDSYKVRRAKVGGYRDYFTDEQVAGIDALVDGHLASAYDYGAKG